MKIPAAVGCIGVALISLGAFAQQQNFEIPSGTIIPASLNTTLSSEKSKAGEAISARVAQDVPLPNRMKIKEGAKLYGHVISARPKTAGSDAQISFVFDRLVVGKQRLALTANLRALASMMDVDEAQIPVRGMGESDSWANRTTVQVGGDAVYWGGGPVENSEGPVGQPLSGWVTSGVLVKATAKPGSPCHGEIGDHQGPQAFWVFSSDACGIYGIPGARVEHHGRTKPAGAIELFRTAATSKFAAGVDCCSVLSGRLH